MCSLGFLVVQIVFLLLQLNIQAKVCSFLVRILGLESINVLSKLSDGILRRIDVSLVFHVDAFAIVRESLELLLQVLEFLLQSVVITLRLPVCVYLLLELRNQSVLWVSHVRKRFEIKFNYRFNN